MRNAIHFFAALLMMAAVSVSQAADQAAGMVGYMSGTLVAQRTDGTIKVLGTKSEVFPGDMLVTAKGSYAQVKLNDGSQMTLRPNSNLRIEAFQFNKDAPKEDNMALRLLKGGFRTVTGMIGKRGNADAYKLRAASATIGIRGTNYSSRLCATQDCKDEDEVAAKPAVAPPPGPQVIGRVMLVQGELSAEDKDARVRKLILGATVYEGDILSTGNKAHAVVAFRDGGRITLQDNSVFKVEQFKYDKAGSQENAVLRLLKGGVRVVTGLIGRSNRDNYQFKVSSATIGIRGTGFDAWCNGPCASGTGNPGATQGNPLDGAGVYVWQGEVVMVSPGGSFVVAVMQAAIIARDTGKPVPIVKIPEAIKENTAPRPDSVPADIDKLFGTDASAGEPGLYVTVHDGQVILVQGENELDLGSGDTGFAKEGILTRLATTPAFMDGDPKLDPTGSGLKDSDGGGIPESGCKL